MHSNSEELCVDLQPKQRCFRAVKYMEGKFIQVFHQHVPKHRMSEENAHEALRSMIARFSDWPGEWIVGSLLNERDQRPERYPGFTAAISYPEPGVLRHTVSSQRLSASFDVVIAPDHFRNKGK